MSHPRTSRQAAVVRPFRGYSPICPAPATDRPADPVRAAAQAVETTLAGQVFHRVRILPSNGPDRPRLRIPLLDGMERLGVLEAVVLTDPAALYRPPLSTLPR
jgi:hypothetical protein